MSSKIGSQTKIGSQIAAAIESLTGDSINLDAPEVKGRNIWGRVAFNRSGMLHVEITQKDKQVNDAVMPSLSGPEMELGGEERYRLYRQRCKEVAAEMNSKAITDNKLILFVSSNRHLTKKFKGYIEDLL